MQESKISPIHTHNLTSFRKQLDRSEFIWPHIQEHGRDSYTYAEFKKTLINKHNERWKKTEAELWTKKPTTHLSALESCPIRQKLSISLVFDSS